MSFLDIASRRFSSRKYQTKPVEKEKLMLVLEAARIAPSAANKQPWLFYVITDEEGKKKICDAYHREWLQNASVIIVACADHRKAWIRSDKKDHCDIDIAIAVDHMTLAATDLGLATCWICNFNPAKCREILKLAPEVEPIVILPLAYPADSSDPHRHDVVRRPLEEIVKFI
jgi:nitroreductase